MNYNYESGKPTYLVLSFKFWVLTLLLVLVYSVILMAQNTVYVDPENGGDPDEDGSFDHPFDSWADVSFADNSTYLQKRGTTAQGNFAVSGKNYLTIGAYGTGENPVITGVPGASARIMAFNKSNHCTVENITFVGHHPNAPVAGVYITGWPYAGSNITTDITVRNCDISYCYNGIRILPGVTDVDKVTVDSCTIHHINEDGIFATDLSNFTCSNSHIYKVNMDWHYYGHNMSDAPGDGIQLSNDCDNFLIENTIIDRRYTGLKFCFIHNATNSGFENDGIIRDCTFYPPKDTVGAPSAGGALFMYDGDTLIIERTKFIGSDRLYSTDAGVGGEIGFDHVIMNYCLGDSVHTLRTNMLNDHTLVNNVTWTSNHPGATCLKLVGGLATIRNSAIAAGPNTIQIEGIITQDSNLIYNGPKENWAGVFGWIDWENGNYKLTDQSPIKNKGLDVSLYFDMDSIPVPQGPCQDLGAYEYIEGGQGNNNAPQINNQSFNIDENALFGAIVGTVLASDPDAGQVLTYSITSGNTNAAFSINPSSGELTVNTPAALNFEVTPVFNLVVMVTDNGSSPLSASAGININLNDINEPPEIVNQSFAIDENSTNGSSVGIVIATDPDNGQSLAYGITSGNTDNAFNINAATGEITVSNTTAINFEQTATFSLTVTVTDNGSGSLSNQASVNINLNDINEPPEIVNQSF
ncbi:MAG: cadherin domain-containing protein, partial [Bacteroidales bacterium]|nr:cadherin domain-containing protein [Bacteroidales bacterium]